jgi:hypothetical protein
MTQQHYINLLHLYNLEMHLEAFGAAELLPVERVLASQTLLSPFAV